MELGGPWAWLLGLPTAVVYGSLALFVSVLHNVFLLYYVDTFVSVYKINKAAFWVGETVFLLWNSLNDPLFGWLSDRQFLSSQPCLGEEELLVGGKEAGSITLSQYLRQLARHRNFLWFVGMDLVQVTISSSSLHSPLWGVPSPGQSPRPHPRHRPPRSARAASTCWCWCPSPVLCCSCSPGPSSRCTGDACTWSKPSARTWHGPRLWMLRQCDGCGKATLLRTLPAALGSQPSVLLLRFPAVQPGGQMAEWELLGLSQERH